MRFLLVYYGYHETSGRVKELVKSIENEYEITLITMSTSKIVRFFKRIISKERFPSIFGFTLFFFESLSIGLTNKKRFDGIVLCDGASSIIGYFLILFGFKNKFIIQDFFEFYGTESSVFKFRRNFVSGFESKLIKLSHLVICANSYRASLMSSHYNLIKSPFVFENIWRLNEKSDGANYFKHSSKLNNRLIINLIYTGAISSSSQFLNMLMAVKENEDHCHLKIAGQLSGINEKVLSDFIQNRGISNVEFLGFLSHFDLSNELKNSDAGFIFYPLDTLNNIYCAPGKLHEYLFECLPIITSTNPPLKKFVNKHSVGISSDNFTVAVQEIQKNYIYYKENTKRYLEINKSLIQENRRSLLLEFNKVIGQN